MFVLEGGKRFVIPRTEMTYPGHSMKLHQNAADPVKSPVDHVMMDFEDACPYEFKGPKSRQCVVEALTGLDFGKKVITVRPNNIRSEFFLGDLEAIVLGAEEPSRIRGGARLGGRGGRLENFVGDVTKYVVNKAPCRVIVTAPPEREGEAEPRPELSATGR